MELSTNNIDQRNQSLLFLKSLFSTASSFPGTDDVMAWLKEQNNAVAVKIDKIPFAGMAQWTYDSSLGYIRHESGKFFTIDGIHVKTNWESDRNWEQPIINQAEIGYLGFLAKEFNGILHFLVQAKIEPGNVNCVQLSPTLQATRSNYMQVHKGRKPRYLEYFKKATPGQILLDQLQSEQGARFLRKRNRNIIIKVDEDLPVHDSFKWLTLGQIKKLMLHDNLVNMDTRTVISGIPFGSFEPAVIDFFNFLSFTNHPGSVKQALLKSALSIAGSLHTIENIITFLTQLKSVYDLDIRRVPLDKLQNWIFGKSEIVHEEKKYFKVIAVDVEIGEREVEKWSQPMIEPAQEGLCAFVGKEINGLLHFAVQAKLECGNHDIIEFAPTVQCLTGNYKQTRAGALPFLDYVLKARPDQIVVDAMQSEEGGRFYKEQNRNLIVIAGDDVPVELPERYIWMTLNQLFTFLKFNNYLNVQARSLIAAMPIN